MVITTTWQSIKFPLLSHIGQMKDIINSKFTKRWDATRILINEIHQGNFDPKLLEMTVKLILFIKSMNCQMNNLQSRLLKMWLGSAKENILHRWWRPQWGHLISIRALISWLIIWINLQLNTTQVVRVDLKRILHLVASTLSIIQNLSWIYKILNKWIKSL